MATEHVDRGRKGGLISGQRSHQEAVRRVRDRAFAATDLIREPVAHGLVRKLLTQGVLDVWLQAIDREGYVRGYNTGHVTRRRQVARGEATP